MSIITVNADIYWAKLNKQDDNGKYTVELCNLSDAATDKLKSMGLTVKSKEDKKEKGSFITCSSNYPMIAYDTDDKELSADTLIANGSKGRAAIGFYDWRNGKGRSPKLIKLIVTDLIEFTAEGGTNSLSAESMMAEAL